LYLTFVRTIPIPKEDIYNIAAVIGFFLDFELALIFSLSSFSVGVDLSCIPQH
jgi:hypothetical protein